MDLNLDKKGGAPSTNFNARDIVPTYIEEAEIIESFIFLQDVG